MLAAFALVALQTARPASAEAAKVTVGRVTGTIYFSKGETSAIANFDRAVCGVVPAAGRVACQVGVGGWSFLARRARDRGMCLKVKFVLVPTNPPVYWPDTYRGGYCR